jgi:lactoylglutathione lyase
MYFFKMVLLGRLSLQENRYRSCPQVVSGGLLGFSLVTKDKTTARLKRDDVEIGLAVNGQDPEQASCWFSVGDVDALWREYEDRGTAPGVIDEQEYGGKPLRVFFAKDCYGVCFCFTHPLGQDG